MRTFLNLTSFSPQMAFALCAFLERRGGDEEEDVIQAWLAPRALFTRGRPPDDWGYAYALDVAEHLDLIERVNGALRLRAASNGSLPIFRAIVRERIMGKGARSPFRAEDPTDELTQALAWWSHQPPQVLTSRTFEPFMEGLPFKPVLQPTRWMVFERWATFLGFGWRFGEGLLPDPTAAVTEALDRVVRRGETLAAPEFVDRLASELPVLDRGKVFKRYRNAIGLKAPSDVLGAPVSLALLRLADRGELDFPPLKDAAGITIKCGPLERRVASVRRSTKPPKSGRTK
jgi:hypothetical protein